MHTITLISPAHGQATLARLWEWAMWKVRKMDEVDALAVTIERLMRG